MSILESNQVELLPKNAHKAPKEAEKMGIIALSVIDGELYTLVVQEKNETKNIGFPKGSRENKETFAQTAKRELEEETGIIIEYSILNRATTIKFNEHFYFIIILSPEEIKLSHKNEEITEIGLLNITKTNFTEGPFIFNEKYSTDEIREAKFKMALYPQKIMSELQKLKSEEINEKLLKGDYKWNPFSPEKDKIWAPKYPKNTFQDLPISNNKNLGKFPSKKTSYIKKIGK